MIVIDPIADMLTRIRNANTRKHESVNIPLSKVKLAIAKILLDEGYITSYTQETVDGIQMITITLKYGPNGEKLSKV